jgi:hypothetical protein
LLLIDVGHLFRIAPAYSLRIIQQAKRGKGFTQNMQSYKDSTSYLEKALQSILTADNSVSQLSQVLVYASVHSTVSYRKIEEIIKDDPEDVLLLADQWRLLLPVRTAKSAAWEDRVLLLQDGEIYEIPNVVRYLVKNACNTGKWDPEETIIELFKEFEDPDWERIAELIRSITQEATDYKITSNQIKKLCLRFGLSNRIDGLIAEMKATGIISPKLSDIADVIGAQSPIYEINPSITM